MLLRLAAHLRLLIGDVTIFDINQRIASLYFFACS